MSAGTVTRPGSDEPGGRRSGQQQAGRAAGQPAPPASAPGLREQGLGLGCARGAWPGRGDHRTRRTVPSIEHGTTITRTMFDVNIDRAGPGYGRSEIIQMISDLPQDACFQGP
jgi:hypothetical protein